MNDWINVIASVGFPIVACIGLGFYIREIQKEHKEETTKMTEALNNNTLALQKIIDKIDALKDE